jgi:hypothetical protein
VYENFLGYREKAPGSFIVKTGDRMVVRAISAEGIYMSKSTVKELGRWHLNLIVTAAKAFVDPAFLDPGNRAEAKAFVTRLKTCVQHARDGGIGGVPMLAMHCPVALWHPKQDGASVDGVAVPDVAGRKGGQKRKKKKTAADDDNDEEEEGTPLLLSALKSLDVQLRAKTANTKEAITLATKAAKAVAVVSAAGELEGISFLGGTTLLPTEVSPCLLFAGFLC